MKKTLTVFAAALALAACKVDLVDINTSSSTAALQSEMTVDIRVSGELVSTKSPATETEGTVRDFDLLVFRSTSEGNFLEFAEFGIVPDKSDAVPGTKDRMIWSSKLTLPTSGTKRVVAVGNGARAVYPDMVVGETTYEDFCAAFHFDAFENKTNEPPLVMGGVTLVASSADSHIFVRLARQYNRFDITNGVPDRLAVNKVQVTSAPSQAFPFAGAFEADSAPEFIPYPEIFVTSPSSESLVKDKLYLLYTPAGDPDICVSICFWGRKDGVDFRETILCEQPLYPDYNTVMTLGLADDGTLTATYTPDYDSFQTEGAPMTYNIASWLWTGLMGNNDYAQAWLAGNPVVSPEGASMSVVDIKNPEYSPAVSFSTGTTGQLKNRLRAHSMYTGDYILWTVPVAEAKKGGSLGMINGMISSTQWGPKYFILEYSFDQVEWKPAQKTFTEKTESGADRNVTYSIKLAQQDAPQPLDFTLPLSQSLKDATLYVRLVVADACCSKAANGDIDATKTAGIAYVHVKNYDTADKDKVFDEDWSSITFTYTEPEK